MDTDGSNSAAVGPISSRVELSGDLKNKFDKRSLLQLKDQQSFPLCPVSCRLASNQEVSRATYKLSQYAPNLYILSTFSIKNSVTSSSPFPLGHRV
jgi:hypothetical protein